MRGPRVSSSLLVDCHVICVIANSIFDPADEASEVPYLKNKLKNSFPVEQVAKQLSDRDSKHEAEVRDLRQLARSSDSLKTENERLATRIKNLEESNKNRQNQFDTVVKAKDALQNKYAKDIHELKVEISSRERAFDNLLKGSEEAGAKHAEEIKSLQAICQKLQNSFDSATAMLEEEKSRHEGVVTELQKDKNKLVTEMVAKLKKAEETVLGKLRSLCRLLNISFSLIFADMAPLAFCPEAERDTRRAALQACDISIEHHALSEAGGSVVETCWSAETLDKCVVTLQDLLAQVGDLVRRMRSGGNEICKTIWPDKDVPTSVFSLADHLSIAPERIDELRESAARLGAEMTLSLMLSWYPNADVRTIASGARAGVDLEALRPQVRQAASRITEYLDLDEIVPKAPETHEPAV